MKTTMTWLMAHQAWLHSISSWGNINIQFSYWLVCTSRYKRWYSVVKVKNHESWRLNIAKLPYPLLMCTYISVKPNCHPINVWVTDIFLVQYFLQHEWNISPGHYKVFLDWVLGELVLLTPISCTQSRVIQGWLLVETRILVGSKDILPEAVSTLHWTHKPRSVVTMWI